MEDINTISGSGISNFISHQALDSADICTAIKAELSGRVTVNTSQILGRLHTEAIETRLVDDFLQGFEQRHSDAISALKTIAEDAGNKEANETAMYPHLQKILDDIVNFRPGTSSRRFYSAYNHAVQGEPHLSGFPSLSPDFCCSRERVDSEQKFTWRETDSFLEVKPSSSQGIIPKDFDTTTVRSTLAQTADYARLHMSSRPFQLFSVALVISGSKFVVAIFDRDGVTVSTDFDMWADTAIFVRVIRQITSGLSPVELGADPSVQELEANSPLYEQIRKKSTELHVSPKSINFPSYQVNCPRQLSPRPATPFATARTVPWVLDQWVTIGPPIWSSLSLCGRATTVWRVARMEENTIVNIDEVRILKNAWRRSDRDSESAIYQSIKTPPAGVAEFLQGGDAMAPGSLDVIRVDLLRTAQLSDQSTLILHRLVLKTAGHALWEGNSYLDIVKGVRAALTGHNDLFNQRILHRDISPGNVLLSAKSPATPGEEGFLTDLEFARIPTIVTQDVQEHSRRDGTVVQSTHTQWTDAKRGAVMTGTIHFMAIQLVRAMMNNIAIEHQVHHDVESFIWVLAYAVARRLININSKVDVKTKNEISSFFAGAWGGGSLRMILTVKRALNPLQPELPIRHLLPPPILTLFEKLYLLMIEQMILDVQLPLDSEGRRLTHKDMLDILDQCVVEFESVDYDGPK